MVQAHLSNYNIDIVFLPLGALVCLNDFHPTTLKFCAMHCINLGLCFALNGGGMFEHFCIYALVWNEQGCQNKLLYCLMLSAPSMSG